MESILYHYPNCGTCRKAIAFLRSRGQAPGLINLVEDPPGTATLDRLVSRSGQPITRFFNGSGESYRAGGWKDRIAKTSREDALTALAGDGKLIRRPIWDLGDRVFVGFSEEAWASVLFGST